MNFQSKWIKTNGIKLHVKKAGKGGDSLVIFLHGFPEFWKSFAKQAEAIVKAGYQVMLPDQRGYNLSAKPHRLSSYTLDKLAADIIGLIDATNKEKAFIVGHDWGGAVTWYLAAHYPERVEKSITVNSPHGSSFGRFLHTNEEQQKKSAYMKGFQFPFLPQRKLRSDDYSEMIRLLKDSGKNNIFTDEYLKELKTAWKQKRALPCMLNWYRAAGRKKLKVTEKQLKKQHLIIWGNMDKFFVKGLAEDSLKYCDDGRVIHVEDATHWIHHEQPELVSNEILKFFETQGSK